MSHPQSSLIGFLKKKSLFPASPQKSIRNKQLSRDLKKTIQTPKNKNNNPQLASQKLMSRSSKNLQKYNQEHDFLPAAEAESYLYNDNEIQHPIRYQASTPQLLKKQYSQRNFYQKPKQQAKSVIHQQNHTNNWSGLVNKVVSFQSTRVQSMQCLQNLGFKIESQISSIDFRIDAFHSKISKILNEELSMLKEKIYIMIENIFVENERNMKLYIKQQQKMLAQDLVLIRQNLLRQHQKIQSMRQQINKPNWKKVAGELLSNDLQQKVERMVLKSKSMTIKKWEIQNMKETKLPAIERQLRSLINIR